ncbi:MAG TPA: hypothetical protein VKB41_14165 [Steroidobacteraceae bacterium]|jgi:hypothetical protein|nr:hypothetical protein [Steroidobacteraceae bacterium]
MKMLFACLLCTMLLGACGQDTPPKQEQPMRPEDTFAGDMIKEKNKIEEQAQQQVENRMPELNRELDQAEGAQPAPEPQN